MGLDTSVELHMPYMQGGKERVTEVMYMRKCYSLTEKLVRFCRPYAVESDIVFKLPLRLSFWEAFYTIIYTELTAALGEQTIRLMESIDGQERQSDAPHFDFHSIWDLNDYICILERELNNLRYFIEFLIDNKNYPEFSEHFEIYEENELDLSKVEIYFINSD